MITESSFTQVNNDFYGNPRYVLHYSMLANNYDRALKLAKEFGGKKFHNRQYGGGIVFTTYFLNELADKLNRVAENSMENPTKTGKLQTVNPAIRQAAKSLGITVKKTGNKYEYLTKDGKKFASFPKAVEAAKRDIAARQNQKNPFGFSLRTAAAKALAKSKLKGLQAARDKAKAAYEKAERAYSEVAQMVNPARKRRNAEVEEVFELFQGRESTGEFEAVAPTGTPNELAELGRLVWLEIRTPTGEFFTVDFNTPNNQSPTLCADTRGNLHIVGGTYRMADEANSTLGTINRIAYETHKDHIGDGQVYEFVHEFSEDSGGEQPKLKIDKDGLFKITGGVYTLSQAGIED